MILPNLISFGWFPPPPKAVDKKNNNNQENDESSRSSNNNNKGNAMLAQFTKNLTVLQDSVMFRDQLKAVAVNAFRQLEFQYADESVEENRPLSHVNLTIVLRL